MSAGVVLAQFFLVHAKLEGCLRQLWVVVPKELLLCHKAFIVDVFHGFVQNYLCSRMIEGKAILGKRVENEFSDGQRNIVAVFVLCLAYYLFSVSYYQLCQKQFCSMRSLALYVGCLPRLGCRNRLLAVAIGRDGFGWLDRLCWFFAWNSQR